MYSNGDLRETNCELQLPFVCAKSIDAPIVNFTRVTSPSPDSRLHFIRNKARVDAYFSTSMSRTIRHFH